ncbi:cAMP-dependent protein kinase catalytic subunit 3-like [Pollicipes pollicipes]|uniref:cAMP-dependent protein kinase catalytic subunit 3-like n=1 Tax=Pollicipes pollicipes TaxID=41117 RepID=UPI001884D6BC|nr:cAMP-dependent protein kinase catalytic subunit 3-like [Pollicipes pollicipes]
MSRHVSCVPCVVVRHAVHERVSVRRVACHAGPATPLPHAIASRRLPPFQSGAEDVKRHRWFKNTNWEEVYYRKLKPPIVPKVSYDGDTRNFDDYPETNWQKAPAASEKDMRHFLDF